jgi:ribonuclease P protein component
VAGEFATWRASRQWLTASARVEPLAAPPGPEEDITGDTVDEPTLPVRSKDDPAGVRFGFTVARRQARRAVQRAMVKRLLREAARAAAPALHAARGGRRVDLVLRLRSPLPDRTAMGLSQLKRSLRSEADSLMAQLARHLRAASATTASTE